MSIPHTTNGHHTNGPAAASMPETHLQDMAATMAHLDTDGAIDLLCGCADTDFRDLLWQRVRQERLLLQAEPSWLEDSRVMDHLCGLPDAPFTEAVLTLAGAEYAGLNLLYEDPIMRRIAAMQYAHRQGTFLKVARNTVAGFDRAEYSRELRPYLQRQQAQEALREIPWNPISAADLLAMEFPPLLWVVEDILPAGLTLLTGRGKDGKSLLVWNLCLAVATGGLALGRYSVMQGDVLYLDLEDGGRRAQERLKQACDLFPDHASMPKNFEILTWHSPRVGEGLEERLTQWLDTHPNARMIAIDILEKIRPKRRAGGSVYEDDYNALASLQKLAQDRNVAMVVVHHSNKSKPEDFRDTASGSMGLIGACDTFWGLSRVAGKSDAMLRITGREVSEQELAMQFDDGFWTVLSTMQDAKRSQAATEILDALRQAGGPLAVTHLAMLLQVPDQTMRVRLCRMTRREEVRSVGEGMYALPTYQATPPPGSMTVIIPDEPPVENAVSPVREEVPSEAPVGEVQEETPAPAATTVPPSITALTGKNGFHSRPMRPICSHRWEIEGGMSRCGMCGVCHPIKA